ncbi:MAG: hypothetical protein KGY66_01855 [Candidatus Thermoplasmatota archaeon]|nr:hypothetical protein [Candidatus Thermoplasmatota archaeon]MBS3789641.1 hypothetical protein [Candidatus Thermoplasmatota archaeon]
MDSGIKLLLTIILPALLILGSVYGLGNYVKGRTLTSEYEYEVVINPDEDIYNFTLEVPFPSDLSEGDISAPPQWNHTIDEDENMLRIEAEKIENIFGDRYRKLSLSIDTEDEIDTLDPWDNEPMLEPGSEFTKVECNSSDDSERLECYNYTGTVNATYDAESGTEVAISVELSGMNRWWLIEDIENQYFDRLSVDIEGDGEGEYTADGQVKTGMGTY